MPSLEPEAAPFLAWPVWRDLRATLGLCLGFLAFFYTVYGGADALTHLHTTRYPLHLPGELSLPFVPAMAVVYVSMNALLGLMPFVYRSARELWPVVITLAIQTLVAGVFFVALPVDLRFEHATPTGFVGAVFAYADTLNLRHNEFPSLHVTFALTAALLLGQRASPRGRALLLGWAAAISASTVLIHAHYVLDVVGGGALALLGVYVVYPWVLRRWGSA
jgi:membrane-associated phospholipid phosphatase